MLSLKNKKISIGLKTTIAILISQMITQGISFLTTPIFTRLMSVEEYGLVSQYNAWLSIVAVFATLSLSAGVFQVAMNEFPEDRNRFTFSAIILSNLATIFIFGIFLGFKNFFTNLFELPLSLLVLMGLYNLLNPAMQMWIAKQKFEYGYKKLLLISVLAALVSQISAVLAVLFVKDCNLGVVKLWGSVTPMLLFSAGLYISIGIKSKFKVNGKYIKYALIFNLPLLVHYLAQHILSSSDKIMITAYMGSEATGIYSLASTIAYIAILVWAAMAASLTPYIYENLNVKAYDKINKMVLLVILLFGTCCFAVCLIGPEVVYILGGEKYMEGIYLIPPIAASCLLQSVYSCYSDIAFYHHKRFATMVMTVIAAGLNILLNMLLIPKFGYVGAAYATEIAYLIYTFLHFINYRRIAGKVRVYNDWMVWGIVSAVTVGCILLSFIYKYLILRYALLGCIIIVCIVFRKKLFAWLKNMMARRFSSEESKEAEQSQTEEKVLEAEHEAN